MKTCGFILQQGTLEQETNKKPPSAHAWPRQGKVSAQKFVAIYCTENTKNKTDTHFSPLPPNSKKFERWSFKFRATYLKKKEKTKTNPQTNSNKETSTGSLANTSPKGSPLEGRREASVRISALWTQTWEDTFLEMCSHAGA